MKEKGLTLDEVEKLIKNNSNYVKNKTNKSVWKIITTNIFTYFNAIFCLISVLLIIAGEYKNLTFLFVIIVNLLIGIIQQIHSKRVLDKLALLDISKYITVREGKEYSVLSTKLVLGDIIKLEAGQQIPADAKVISGQASVNESLLTGEPDEIEKVVGSELKSGSFVVSGTMYAKLTHVGKDSYVARLTSEAKKIKEKKSEMILDIERIISVAGILIIPIGSALFFQAMYINGATYKQAIVSMVAAVIGMIPEGLYLLVTIALALSASRLAKKKVLLHDMRSIETLARVDVLCVDKTGTITSDVMTVTDVFGCYDEDNKNIKDAKKILTRYIQTVSDNNITMNTLREYFDLAEPLEAVEVNPFNSKTKYSEVKMKDVTYRLGAPEFLLDRNQLEQNVKIIEKYTSNGKRVIVLVEEKNNRTNPILFIAMANEIRENAVETFSYLQEQGVDIKVISGDNALTVSKVSKMANIRNADKYVDASTLDTEEKIMDAVKKYTVFGRVNPEQKKQIIEAIKKNGSKVAMTGDGVNDILAMKEADCSIAMGTGSDATRQAAQVVLLDSDFSRMKNIIYEGRRNINNITRSATLFLYKNIFSLLLAVFSIIATYNYPLKPTQISVISLFNIGIPAFLLSLEPNEKKQKGRFITNVLVKSIPAALTSFFSIIVMMFFANLFDISSTEVGTASIYLISVVGFNILWNITRPIKKYHLMVFGVCILGICLAARFLYNIFDITDISLKATALCLVFAIAEMTIIRNLSFAVVKINRGVKQKNNLINIKKGDKKI